LVVCLSAHTTGVLFWHSILLSGFVVPTLKLLFFTKKARKVI
jgi:hypothetical protein